MNKEKIDEYLLLFLDSSFEKKATEDIFYNLLEMLEKYYEGKYYSDLDIANNKLKEAKDNTESLRKVLFEEMAEQYGNDENGGDFINIDILPKIDKILSIIGSD